MHYLTRAGVNFLNEKIKYHHRDLDTQTKMYLGAKSELRRHETEGHLSDKELADVQHQHTVMTARIADHHKKIPAHRVLHHTNQIAHFSTQDNIRFDRHTGKIIPKKGKYDTPS